LETMTLREFDDTLLPQHTNVRPEQLESQNS
jgi:hypothetical protein